MSWGQLGRDIIEKLRDNPSEEEIRLIAEDALQKINEADDPEKRKSGLASVGREIRKVYPRLPSGTENYYFDEAGKKDLDKWRHIIFKYLTLDKSDWDAVGDEARAEWKQQQQTVQAQVQLTIKTMKLENLELDSETQSIVETALSNSGMDLATFIQQSVKVYAKTLVGKAQQRAEDLSAVSTKDLLESEAYKTQPGKAEELTKRAIRAIKIHNKEYATEQDQRWCITQSAIAELTGSRPSSIGTAMKPFKTEIDEHNQEMELNPYSNRKGRNRDIRHDIDLPSLVPSGLAD